MIMHVEKFVVNKHKTLFLINAFANFDKISKNRGKHVMDNSNIWKENKESGGL